MRGKGRVRPDTFPKRGGPLRTSTVALSVSILAMQSPDLITSPSFLDHSAMTPCVMVAAGARVAGGVREGMGEFDRGRPAKRERARAGLGASHARDSAGIKSLLWAGSAKYLASLRWRREKGVRDSILGRDCYPY
jgi:hypothetical protein